MVANDGRLKLNISKCRSKKLVNVMIIRMQLMTVNCFFLLILV